MKIIIIGCGLVGRTLIEQLSEEGHDITAIDEHSDIISDITTAYDVIGITGNGASFQTLNDADIAHTDLLIAVTDSDEQNLLCCVIGKKVGNCKTIARVRNPIYHKEAPYLKEEFDLAMIVNPEAAAAGEISRIIRFPFAQKIDAFAKGKVDLVHFKIQPGSSLVGYSLQDINTTLKCDMLVCLVTRGKEVIIPNGDFIIEANDVIAVVAETEKVNTYFKKISKSLNRVKSVMILGGGRISYYLTQLLIKSDIQVKIIEPDFKRCEHLSEQLPQATIIHGKITDQDLLFEEGIEDIGAVIALSESDEENILVSLFAKSFSTGKIITKINQISFSNVLDQISLDSIVYPRYITADYIIKQARSMRYSYGSNVETLYKIADGKAECLEFIVREYSDLLDTPLQSLKIKKNILICCINRDGKIIVPSGQDCIKIGDSVVVVLKDYKLTDISEILEK